MQPSPCIIFTQFGHKAKETSLCTYTHTHTCVGGRGFCSMMNKHCNHKKTAFVEYTIMGRVVRTFKKFSAALPSADVFIDGINVPLADKHVLAIKVDQVSQAPI